MVTAYGFAGFLGVRPGTWHTEAPKKGDTLAIVSIHEAELAFPSVRGRLKAHLPPELIKRIK